MNIVVVDDKDNPTGVKSYEELVYEDIYQVASLWLTDEKTGDVLIAQRKWSKQNDPGKWSAAAAGTVDEGESYDINIVKEIEEEIGLTGLNLTKGPKEYIDEGKHKYFVQWYLAEINKEGSTITIQEDEVEAVEWLPEGQLIVDVKTNPDKYTPNFIGSLKRLGYSVE